MITGLTVVLTSLTIVILLTFGARQRHRFADGVDVFRYPSVFVWTAFAGIIFFSAVPFIVYFLATPNKNPAQLYLPVAIFGSIALLMAWAYLHMRKFYVAVSDATLEIGGIGATRVVPFRDVRRIVIVEGGKGGKELSAYDRENRLLLRTSSVIQDFEELLSMVMQRIPARDVQRDHRDKWGKWSKG